MDFKFPLHQVESQRSIVCVECSILHPLLVAPAHISRDAFALRLCKGRKQGCHHLTGHISRINVFLLEEDTDTQQLQFPKGLQTLFRVSGKPRDGFDQDSVNEPSSAVSQEPLKIASFFCRSSCDALIRVNVHHAPILLAGNQGGVVAVLSGKGIELILGV